VASEPVFNSADAIKSPSARPARLATAVAEELVALIVSGQYAEGTLLPTEPVLAERFGVSRVVVREALRFLEQKGLLRVRHGQGSTVLPSDEWDLLDNTVLAAAVLHDESHTILEEVVAIRIILESQLAGEAAIRCDERALAEMKDVLDRMNPDVPEDFPALDQLFHKLVVRASANLLGAAILRDVMREAAMIQSYIGLVDRAQLELSVKGHQAIFDAISEHDARAAVAAMREHIYRSWILRSEFEPDEPSAPFVAIADEVTRATPNAAQ
jgi:DNA-binding FadR family transcriptional regulator